MRASGGSLSASNWKAKKLYFNESEFVSTATFDLMPYGIWGFAPIREQGTSSVRSFKRFVRQSYTNIKGVGLSGVGISLLEIFLDWQ